MENELQSTNKKEPDQFRPVLIVIYSSIAIVLIVSFVAYKTFAHFSNFPGFWTYWFLISIFVAIVLWLSVQSQSFREKLGKGIEKLIESRNYRVRTLIVLTIVLTISAALAGMGRPLLLSSLASYNKDTTFEEQMTKQKWWDTWIDGKNHTDTKEYNQQLYQKIKEKREKARIAEEKYSSWWHFNIAVLMWIFTILYWFKAKIFNIFSSITEKINSTKDQ